VEALRKKEKTGWNSVYHQNWWFSDLTLCMTKLRVLMQCLSYFVDYSNKLIFIFLWLHSNFHTASLSLWFDFRLVLFLYLFVMLCVHQVCIIMWIHLNPSTQFVGIVCWTGCWFNSKLHYWNVNYVTKRNWRILFRSFKNFLF